MDENPKFKNKKIRLVNKITSKDNEKDIWFHLSFTANSVSASWNGFKRTEVTFEDEISNICEIRKDIKHLSPPSLYNTI